MKVIYLDTKDSGISGDILLSALLELTDDPKKILKELEELKDYLSGISILQIKLEKIKRHELKINKLNIIIKENKDHRTVNELKESLARFLKDKEFSLETSKYAKNVLNSLINAEAKVHENLPEKVHLHELSSVDTLIDIIGVTKALNEIGYFSQKCNLYMSELPLGGGKVKTAHGILPVPAPATMKIVENSKLDVKLGPIENEITTPTGAALLTNLNITLKSPKMKIYKVAYSTGEKEFKDFLNILKIYYGEQTNLNNPVPDIDLEQYHQNIAVLETNVDDVTGENIGNFINIMESEDILDIQVIRNFGSQVFYIRQILC
ncbi:MAG: LarC family nickel insertion protein [Candidatus Lokiarchaeota archaeon]